MANSLNADLLNRRVLLKKDAVADFLKKDIEKRTVTVIGGFGSSSFTSGTALLVRWYDGEESRMNGYDVQKIVE